MTPSGAALPGDLRLTKGKLSSRAFLLIAGVYLALRLSLLFNPGHHWDLDWYKGWLLSLEHGGISQIYRTSDMDYPPVYAYILAPLAKIHSLVNPQDTPSRQDSILLTVFVKFPAMLFEFGVAWLLYRWTMCRHCDRRSAWLLPMAYLLNPAVLFDSAYWGEPDSIHTFFVLAAFLTIAAGSEFWRPTKDAGRGRATADVCIAWICLTLATLMKPLGAPFFPLLLVVSVLLYGISKTLVGLVAAALTGFVVFWPFLATHQARDVFQRVFSNVASMPLTSVNAHNLWWLLGAWRASEVPWLGPLTATHVAIILFGSAYLLLLSKATWLRSKQGGALGPAQIIALAVMVGFSFFLLATHMHENHLFAAVPLSVALMTEDRVWRNFSICLSVSVFVNLALHDRTISEHWPCTIGGPSTIQDPAHERHFYLAEAIGIWSSTAFNLVLYAIAMFRVCQGGRHGWLERLAPSAINSEIAVSNGSA